MFLGRRHSSRYSHGHGAGEGKDVLCSPPIITHTAATPQGSPNNTLESNLMKDLKDRLTPLMAFHIPGQSFESIDKTSVSFLSDFHSVCERKTILKDRFPGYNTFT